MGLYEVPLTLPLLGFGMGTMLANFHMCGIMLVLRAVFNMMYDVSQNYVGSMYVGGYGGLSESGLCVS